MGRLTKKQEMRIARKKRVRRKVSGTTERPRMSVFRSIKETYVQVIDDTTAQTLVSVSSLEKTLQDEMKKIREEWQNGASARAEKREKALAEVQAKEAALADQASKKGKKKKKGPEKPVAVPKKKNGPVNETLNTKIGALVGQVIAKRCLEQGIEKVSFDTNGYRYHGRVRALAEGARKAGLKL